MRKPFIIFFSIFFAGFFALNYYIGLRTWQTLGAFLPPGSVFWPVWWMLAATPVARIVLRILATGTTNRILAFLGGYWLAVTFYASLVWLCADLLRLGAGIDLSGGTINLQILGLIAWSAVILLLAYGTWNANHPVIQRYRIAIEKSSRNFKQLNAVLVSDVHLGPIVGNRRLKKLVRLVNGLDPDIVFFAGDTIDENVAYATSRGMPGILRELKAKYGTYAVLGNHEYIGGQSRQAIAALESSGFTVLRDNYVKIADSFYLVGREDKQQGRITSVPRAPLAGILAGIDHSLPVILLDHQPAGHDEAQRQGVDLQLSGHTHRGQIFPNNLITRKVFAVDWGFLRIKSLQIIVSAGYGTWGPPIRIGNRPEIVQIILEFTGEARVKA